MAFPAADVRRQNWRLRSESTVQREIPFLGKKPYTDFSGTMENLEEKQDRSESNMGAGHGGAPGQFKQHKETAMEFAFLLDLAERKGARPQ